MDANRNASGLTAEEIIRICRSEIESIHNLQYLLVADADDPEMVRQHTELLGKQLRTMTDLLCRRVPTFETAPR